MIEALLTLAGFLYVGGIMMLAVIFIGIAVSMFISGVLGLAAVRSSKRQPAPAPAQPLRCDMYGNIVADDGLPIEPEARADLIRSKLAGARPIRIASNAPDPIVARYN